MGRGGRSGQWVAAVGWGGGVRWVAVELGQRASGVLLRVALLHKFALRTSSTFQYGLSWIGIETVLRISPCSIITRRLNPLKESGWMLTLRSSYDNTIDDNEGPQRRIVICGCY